MKISMQPLPRDLQKKVRAQAENLRNMNLTSSLTGAFEVMDEVAAHRPGTGTSRLAQMALKVKDEGDSTLADLGAVEILKQLTQIQGGGAQLPATLNMILSPIATVLAVTFDSLSTVIEGQDFIQTVAQTGVKAIEAEQESKNPLGSGMAAEPFVLGLSEHDHVNEKAAKVSDVLQEQVPAVMAQPAREAYRSVLSSLAKEESDEAEEILAGAGLALYGALPGKENDIAPLALGIMNELSFSDNPLTSAVVTEAYSLASRLIEKEETKQQAGPVIEAVLRTVAQSDGSPRTNQEAGSLGQRWFEEVKALQLSSEQKQELALPYFETITEELDSPVTSFGAAWVGSIEEENFEARSAIMIQVLKTASEHPNAGPTAVFTAAQEVAKDNPELRHVALGGFLAQLGEEVGQPELGEYREQAFSAESLSSMGIEVERLLGQFAG